jgi:hypothetical protein
MFKITGKAGSALGLSLLAACTVALAADNVSFFNPVAMNEFDRPDGGHVVESAASGFTIMGDTSDSLHMSNTKCDGTTQYDADGNVVQGGGFCTLADKDHEAIWTWWAMDADGGTWGVIAGTGKYEGATGSGTWEFGERWPDGKFEDIWRGEINLK